MKKKLIGFIAIVLSILIPLQSIALAKVDFNNTYSEHKRTILVKYKDGNLSFNSKLKGSKIKKHLKNKKIKLVETDDAGVKKIREDKDVLFIEEDSSIRKLEDKITWNVEQIKAPQLLKKNYSGTGVKVAVFDTGIETQNNDLNVKNGVSFIDGVSSYTDDNGHGTAVAGILSSIKNDSGLLGVAPNIDLYSVKILDKNGDGKYSNIIDGLQWAIDNKINIVTMCFGGIKYSKILQEAINEAYSNNILIIAAAGNNGDTENVDFPARYKNVISVGAVDKDNAIASFSNRGKQLDLVAPGVSIETLGLGNTSQITSGTSFAVPHVAGVAAELLSAKKTLSNSQMRKLLLGTAVSLGNKNTYGYGLVDADKALKNINKTFKNIPEKAEVTSDNDSGGNGNVHASVQKYTPAELNIKLGESATLGLQYSENHNNIVVTINYGGVDKKTETISVEGEAEYGCVTWYTCGSEVLNEAGTYTVRFHCPEYPEADEVFTINVEEERTIPNMPTGVSLTPHSNYMVINWNSVKYAESYRVMVDGNNSIGSVDPYCISDTLAPNTEHSFSVRAINELGSSNWSYPVSAYTLASVPVQREGNLDINTLSLKIDWLDNGNPSGTEYKLALFDENNHKVKENAWTTNLTDTISNLKYATTYKVEIKARNFDGIETEWFTFGSVVVPPITQCNEEQMQGQYGYYNDDTQVCVNEPVNIVTGNYYCSEEDINITEIGLPLQVQRSYNSIDTREGILGKSWRMNYESNISIDSETGNAVVTYPDGHAGRFIPKTGGHEFIGPDGIFEQLTKDSNVIYSLKLKDKTVYKYSSSGKLIQISDKNNNTITFTYNEAGQLKTVTGQGGKQLTFSYEDEKLKRITDPANRTIIYTYDLAGNLIKVKGINGEEKNYAYSIYGITSITDQNNKKFIENEYDKFNRVIRQFDENRNEITYTYNDEGKETICHYVTSNISETYQFNDNLYINKIIYSDNTYEEYTFDQWGNKDSIRDRNGNITAYEYDERGNLKSTTSAAPYFYKTIYTYDENDNLVKISSPGGAETCFTYDSMGNVKTSKTKLDDYTYAITSYNYDDNGRIISITDAENNTANFEYSNYPSPTKVTGPENKIISFTYDSLNRTETMTDADGIVTYQYNSNNKVEKIIDKDNNVTRYKYDKLGNLIKYILPEQYNPVTDDGLGVTYEYDAMDMKVKETNAVGTVNAVKYDEFGNIIKSINPNYYNELTNDGVGYSYTYDSDKRLIKVSNPSGKKSRIKYDAVGNKIKEIDANSYNEAVDDGAGIEYIYDQLNSLIMVKNTDGNVVKKLVYDAAGNIIKEIDGKGYISGSSDEARYGTIMKYNLAGWLTEQRTPAQNNNGLIYYNITRYTYDKNGMQLEKKTSKEYVTENGEPDTWNTVTKQYNKSGQVVKVIDTLGEQIEYQYNSLGQLKIEKSLISDGNSIKTYYTYTKLGKVETVKREILSNDLINGDKNNPITYAITSFEYDKNGNIESVQNPEGHITNFEYDSARRLIAKKEEVTASEIDIYNTAISVNTAKTAIMPGEQVDYQIKLNPDRNMVVAGADIYIKYDARICEYIDCQQKLDGISVNASTIGEIKISGAFTGKNVETILSTLRFKLKVGISGKGFITISPISTYKNNDGKTFKFTEGIGKVVSAKTLDMNGDGKVQTNDFTLLAKSKGATPYDLSYDEKYDIDGNGKIDAFDLNYMKEHLFSGNQNSTELKSVEQAKFYEKFTNAVYQDSDSKVVRQTAYEYDKAGNIIKEIYWNGTIEYKYDAYNRLISVKDKANNVSRVFYDEVGNVTKEVLPENYNSSTDNGTGTQYIYDAMNRLVEVRDTNGIVVKRNLYDISGLVIKAIDAAGYAAGQSDSERYGIEYNYDIGNRVETIITPEAKINGKTTSSYKYDAINSLISYTDGEQNTTRYTSDMWGKITSVTDPYGIVTTYSYDKAGNLSELVDGNNNKTTYTYNSLNKLSEMTDPMGQRVTYKYDKEGRLRQHTDRNGQDILYEYTTDGNLTSKRVADKNELVRYLYNMDGSMLATIDSTGVDKFSYNSNGQAILKSRNGKEILKYSYDRNGNVLSVTDQTGQSTGYTYDINNNLKTVKDGNDVVATYSYNIDHMVSGIEYKNGIDISYNYDKDKNISSLLHKSSEGKELNSFEYTYDGNGNMLSKNENGLTTSYTYDKLNRLATSGIDSFKYDNAGNRTLWEKENESIAYSYDSNNRLTTETSSKTGSTVYTYDKNGNQLTSSRGITCTYDAFNQLKSTLLADKTWMENNYDAFGLRVSVCENGLTSEFTYDRGNIIAEVNSSGTLTARSIRGNEIIARKNSAGTLAYYLNNAHEDVIKLVNENCETLNSYQYDAFGNTTNYTEKAQNRFRYAGEQFDEITGQYYLRARHYDPMTGRFTTEDTYRGKANDSMSMNLYTYCSNNPVNFVDPSGHYYIKEGWRASSIYLEKDSFWTCLTRTIVVDFVPFGGLLNNAIEREFGVIGGSSVENYGGKQLAEEVMSEIFSLGGQYISAAITGYNIYSVAKSTIERWDVYRMDEIAFRLIEENRIYTHAENWEKADLIETMDRAYKYILSNYQYFSQKIVGDYTLYQLHLRIKNAKNQKKEIEKIVIDYEAQLIGHYNVDDIKIYGGMFKSHFLSDWEAWLNTASYDFGRHVKFKSKKGKCNYY